MNAQMPRILGFTALAVLGFLLVACGGDGNGNGPAPISAVCGNEGTYHIVGKKQAGKEDAFSRFQQIDNNSSLSLSISEATQLDEIPAKNKDFFERSIKANSEDPSGTKFQKYNYVVCGEDPEGEDDDIRTIWVAKWKVDTNQGISQGISQCRDPKFELEDLGNKKGRMINFLPEEEAMDSLNLNGRQSPCWLKGLDDKLDDGLLDAISKHYMLAQGEGTTIAGFDPNKPDKWSNTEVRYAGEIIVDVEKCEYWLNNGSGTYGPVIGVDSKELRKMARLFSDKLGVGPTFVIDWRDPDNGIPVDVPTKIHVPLDCNNPP